MADTDQARTIPHHSAPLPPPCDFQKVLNRSWPLRDAKGNPHARGISEEPGVDIRVRLVWERDGEQWLDGRAVRWHSPTRHVCVSVDDPRLQVNFVWVAGDDVRRR